MGIQVSVGINYCFSIRKRLMFFRVCQLRQGILLNPLIKWLPAREPRPSVCSLPHPKWSVLNATHRAWSLTIHAAYRAYLLPEFLTLAINIWDSVSLYQITQENATNGSHPLKQHAFQSTCNGGTVILPRESLPLLTSSKSRPQEECFV